MKLNKYQKAAFVRAVMDDLPRLNFQERAEKLVREDNLTQLPAEIRKIAESNTLRAYLKVARWWAPGGELSPFNVFDQTEYNSDYKPSSEVLEKLRELSAEARAERERREALKEKVTGVIEACSTLKVAKERLPEFEKYLPTEEAKAPNVPAVANLVADLMAAGWPADQAQPAAA